MQDLSIDRDTIVVGLDGTEASWAALDWAAAEAARTGATVAVCHAGTRPLPRDLSTVEDLLSRAVTRVVTVLPRERVFAHLRSGDAGRALPRLAATARLLVLGAHTDRPAATRCSARPRWRRSGMPAAPSWWPAARQPARQPARTATTTAPGRPGRRRCRSPGTWWSAWTAPWPPRPR